MRRLTTDAATTGSNRFASGVYNSLLAATPLLRHPRTAPWVRKAWSLANSRFDGPVTTTIYGYPASINFGNAHPVWAREHPSYNNPLIELVYQAHRDAGRQLHVVDVGAAEGDTVLLVKRNCPDMVAKFTCVDGDDEFILTYLRRNMEAFHDVEILTAMLSDQVGTEPSLVRVETHSASARGSRTVPSTTLDAILADSPDRVDVLKTDVDGFDGRVLAGARNLLTAQQPYVLFEWTPQGYELVGTDWRLPFKVLSDCGYDRFIWFTKLGRFSHFTIGYDERPIDATAAYCKDNTTEYDFWYDIAALSPRHSTSHLELADTAYARHSPSRY